MRSRRPSIGGVRPWLLVVALAMPAPALADSGRDIESVMAVVNRQILFSTEVGLVQALRGVTTEVAREALIDELLMYQEAARLRRDPVASDAESVAIESLRSRLPAPLQSDVAAIRRMARRQLVILSYIEFRFRPLIAATEEEVEAERARRAGLSPESARELIERRRLDERVERWIADLRSGARIRYTDLDAEGELNEPKR